MGDLLGAAAGTGGITMAITVLVNLMKLWSDGRKQDAIITRQLSDQHIKAMDAASKRGAGNGVTLVMASLGRFMLLATALGVLVFLTVYAAHNANVPIFVPENEPYAFRILGMTLIELDLGTTWAQFNGVVVFPVWFAIIGGSMGYFFGQAPFDKR